MVVCLVPLSCGKPLSVPHPNDAGSTLDASVVRDTTGRTDAALGGDVAASDGVAVGGTFESGTAGAGGAGGAGGRSDGGTGIVDLAGTRDSRDASTEGASDSGQADSSDAFPGGGTGTGGHTGTGGTSGTGGTTIDGGAKFVGNITTGEQADPDDTLIFSDHWDQITPEHAGIWGSVQAASSFNWRYLDALYAYSRSKGIVFKEHCFVWGSQQPLIDIGEREVRAWMQAFCQRYPETKVIDVVNEPLHSTPSYADRIGGGTDADWKWITNAFLWAREACPNATLVLNDYSIIEYADENQRMIDLVKTIKAGGAPIHAIGSQTHDGAKVPGSTLGTLLEKLHRDTGLSVYITEYEVDSKDDAQQLQIYQAQFPVFWQAEYVHGITLWGWIYRPVWATDSWLVRDGTSRPAMTWLMQFLGRPLP